MGLRHHVTIEDDEELTRRPFVENGIVQVSGLGVVGLAHLLDAAEVTEDNVVPTRLVFLPHGVDQGTDIIAVLPVVADVHRHFVHGIIHRAGRHEGVADDFHRLRVARNHHINGGLVRLRQKHIRKALAGAEDTVPDHKVRDKEACGCVCGKVEGEGEKT